jgi:hypothetical protein
MSRLSTKQRRAQRRRNEGYRARERWTSTVTVMRDAAFILTRVFPFLARFVRKATP